MKLLLAAFLGGTAFLLLVAIARRGAPGAETRDEPQEDWATDPRTDELASGPRCDTCGRLNCVHT